MFIVFCGCEGSGKTTQSKLLADYLSNSGKAILWTKEPGGDENVCRDIREVLLKQEYKGIMDHTAELMLFEADRAQHVAKVIKPALNSGKIVVCDRYNADTYAYQVVARSVASDQEFMYFDKKVTGGLWPDFYFYIDIDPAIGLARKKKDGVLTRFENENLSFHQKVRQGFLNFFSHFVDKDKWQKLDGTKPIAEIHEEIVAAMKKLSA